MINPLAPTDAVPGSPEKLAVILARYDAGLPLWVAGDRQDYEGMSLQAEMVDEMEMDD